MKKVILGLAIATMIISCKSEPKVVEAETTTESVETEMPTNSDTVTIKKTDTTRGHMH